MKTKIRNIGYLLLLLAMSSVAFAQPALPKEIVCTKNYYLLSLLRADKRILRQIQSDTVLTNMQFQKQKRLATAMQGNEFHAILQAVSFSKTELNAVFQRFSALYDRSPALKKLVKNRLIASGCYAIYSDLPAKEQFLSAWKADASGINWTIGVYGEGKSPHYPQIDSIRFNVHDPAFLDTVKKIVGNAIKQTGKNRSFFELPLQAALAFLKANDRNDAAAYEPMAATINHAVVKRTKQINWKKYPYSVLLVPGEGPEQYGVAIDPVGKIRCRLAAEAYKKHLAPFIIVSGGKVHPYKTPYCEAEEMKKYLVDSLNILKRSIIMEPHARHTTTNLRNSARLMIPYGLPMEKPGLVICEKDDEDYISKMDKRCINELGYVPYRLGKRVSDTQLEFYAVREAMTINSTEPLDP